jgi:hypothetical protein
MPQLNLLQSPNFNSKANYEELYFGSVEVGRWLERLDLVDFGRVLGLPVGKELTWATKANFTSSCWSECKCLRRPFVGPSQALLLGPIGK